MSKQDTRKADAEMSLVRLLTAALREEAGMTEQDACRLARAALGKVSERRGGSYIYVGTSAPDRSDVRLRVLSEFTGHNHAELSRAHGISRATLYRWLRQAHQPKQ